MENRRYLSLALSLALIPCFVAPAVAATDLSAELGTLNRQVSALGAFHKDAGLLAKKATLTAAAVDSLQSRSDALKSAVPGVQSAIGSAVRKLKASGEFEILDELLAKKITDSRKRALVLQSSFEAFLQQTSSSLSSSAAELDVPVGKLRSRLPGSTSGTRVTTALSTDQLCGSGKALIGIMIQVGVEISDSIWDITSCACNLSNSIGLGSGQSCSDILWNAQGF